MDLELNRKLINMREKWSNDYILQKLKNIRNNNETENITSEEIDLILKSMNEDYENEKEDIIQKALEQRYKLKKFKIFINKDNYINKQKSVILRLLGNIKSYFAKKYNINNDYSLAYCKSYAQLFIEAYKGTKIYATLKWILIRLSVSEEQYSNCLKSLYSLIGNYDELKNIRKYESIYRNHIFQQQEILNNALSKVSKNVKILKYNCDKTIDNGFFGL